MAFRRKKDQILEHDPDVLVIQECENPDTRGDWPEFSDWRWIGDNPNKGLGVFSRNGLTLDTADVDDHDSEYVLPVSVSGLVDVLGVWAMNDEDEPRKRYIGQVYRALQHCRNFLDSSTIVAGDFNWNRIWDESPNGPLYGDFSDTVEVLNDAELCSSYHDWTGDDFGSEAEPTFFMHKKEERPYHTDYVFIPDAVTESVDGFSVGSYDEWVEASDHVPMILATCR